MREGQTIGAESLIETRRELFKQQEEARAYREAVELEAKSLALSYVQQGGRYGGGYGGSWQRYDFDHHTRLDERTVSSAVWQCIVKLVLSYSSAPLEVYQRGTDKPLPNDTLAALIRRPNEFMTEADLKGLSMSWRAFGGDAYWFIVRAKGDGFPLELWPYHNGHMRPVPGRQRWIDFYLFMEGTSDEAEIPPEDVIHFPWIVRDPQEPWRGLAPLRTIAREIQIEAEINRIIYSVLKNDAMVRGALVDTKGLIVNETQKQIYRTGFHDATTGENAGNIPLLTGGITYQRFGLDLQELDTTALRNVDEARIAGAFLEPLVYSGLTAGQQNTTYDNLQGSRQFFYEDTIVPFWQTDAERVTMRLLEKGDRRYFWFFTRDVVALRKDLNAISTRVLGQWEKGLVTRNEARAQLELEPVEDELDGFFPDVMGTAAPTDVQTSDEPTEEEPLQEEPSEESEEPGEPEKGRKSTDDPEEAKALAAWKAWDTPATDATRKIAAQLARVMDRLEKEVVSGVKVMLVVPWRLVVTIDGKKVAWKDDDDERVDPFDVPRWESAFVKATEAEVEALILAAFERAITEVGANWDDIRSEFDEVIGEVLKGSTSKISESVGTIRDEIRDLLKANSTATAERLRELLTEKFSTLKASRAATIARTTATYATGASQTEAWKELDIEYAWLSQRDGSVRDSHRAADGQRPTDGVFKVGSATGPHPGAMSTAEESVNCRCVLRARPRRPATGTEE